MSLPVAHGLVGATIVVAMLPQGAAAREWKLVAFGALLAILPDFDYAIPWYLHGSYHWHRGFSHSITFALLVGPLLSLFFMPVRLLKAAALWLAMTSHGILDWSVSLADRVELFWPWIRQRYKLGLFEYYNISMLEYMTRTDKIIYLIKIDALEALVFGPLFLLVLWLKRKREAAPTQNVECGGRA
jgi:membrane-bound metal-dependent hydrolase YbcI (DUF457 family)